MKYKRIVDVYDQLESSSKRLVKTYYISELLKKTKKEDLPITILLIQGRVFPRADESKIGVASKMILKAIHASTGIRLETIEKEWKKMGDLGLVTEALVKKKKQTTLFSQELTTKKVFTNLRKLVEIEGTGSVDRKLKLIEELLANATPKEAKYVVKTVLEELRLGVGEGTIRDAVVWAYFADKIDLKFDVKKNDINYNEKYNDYVNLVQGAYDLTNEFSKVAISALEGKEKALKKIKLEINNPIKVMLAMREPTIADAMKRVGKPCAIEYKLDGFRLEIHKEKNKITLFTRRMENVTKQFPEVVKCVKENVKCDSCVLDCEAVGFNPKTAKFEPFQHISQRIKRKYDIDKSVKKLPVELNIFDIVFYNGKNTIKEPFEKRRKIIEKIVKPAKRKIVVVPQIITSSEKEAEEFYKKSLKIGNEGVMFKNLSSPYKPGARVGHMVKFKQTMDTLDLVIVGAEWGSGKRKGWLSSFVLACRDEDGSFLEIGKVGTGFKEKAEHGVSFEQMTKLLKPLITEEKAREVKIRPDLVIEVNYEEIQKSPSYDSSYALRFPRVVRLRDDRRPDECSLLSEVEDLFSMQRGRKE